MSNYLYFCVINAYNCGAGHTVCETSQTTMDIIYEDNHIIIVNKAPGEIVQGDKTGDEPLSESLKGWLKAKYDKPGNVFVGVVHRLDRPVGGLVVFAKTSKALARLNEMFRRGDVHKRYWALTRNTPDPDQGTLRHWLTSVEAKNKSYLSATERPGAKEAVLKYRVLGHSDSFALTEVQLLTGRKHQIRCQLASLGCPIRGDLKYGDRRSNPDGSISLLAHEIDFIHPVSGNRIHVFAPLPQGAPWRSFDSLHEQCVATAKQTETEPDNGQERP